MSDTPRKPMPDLPELKLPLGAWLSAGPIACVVVGGIGYGVTIALGVSQPISALYGGIAASIGVLLGALAVLPWIARPMNHWANLLLGGQLFSFMATIGSGVVIWIGTGAEPAPLGLTGAAGFLVAQLAQASVFQSVARPLEKQMREKRVETAS
jgi:hypothetical protein